MRLLDLMVPASCLLCGLPVVHADEWTPAAPPSRTSSATRARRSLRAPLCERCWSLTGPITHPNRCPVCSIPLPQFVTVCERCRREEFAFARAVAACRYADAPAALVQQFKFSRHRSLASRFAEAMVPLVVEHTPPDAVLVPAPSRRGTVRRRGFAGAVLIAREIAERTGRSLWNVLQARGHRSQKALSLPARRSNAAQAVGLRPGALGGRQIPVHAVLVDDVLTTGTTADSCARRLLECGVSEVVVVVYGLEY